MDEQKVDIQTRNDFDQVWHIISYHRQRVSKTIDDETLRMVWEVGAYVSYKLRHSEWGTGVVRQLSEYIRTQDPTVRGWSYRTIYKMVQLYESYSSESFTTLLETMESSNLLSCQQANSRSEIVPFETAQIEEVGFVPIQSEQIPSILFVRFALNRSMSPMMIMEYKEQLKVGSVIQRSIEEYCKYLNM